MSQEKSKKTLINWDLVSVNPNNKNWNWTDLFYFWGVNIQSIIGFSLIASLYIIYEMNSFVVFFGTIFTSFIDFSSNYFAQFLILIITYIILDFTTLMIYAFAANKVSIWLKDNPKVLNTISACVLIIIAIYVAVSQSY